MAKVNGYGIMAKFMKENGNQELKMDTVFGNLQKEILTKGNGYSIANKVKEFIDIKIAYMKENLSKH